MKNYLLRRGRNRLRVLKLLLSEEKEEYISIKKLKEKYFKIYNEELKSWNIHIFHRDGIVEFLKLDLSMWKPSGRTTNGAIFILDESKQQIYDTDKLRVIPEKYNDLKKHEKLISSILGVENSETNDLQLDLSYEDSPNKILIIKALSFLSLLLNGDGFSEQMILEVINKGFLGDTELKRNLDSLKQEIQNLVEIPKSNIPGEFADFKLVKRDGKFFWIKEL
ncbi:MAG: hypothetical protein ACTSUV_03590 [Candidatus Ranarchaeia archaeon]